MEKTLNISSVPIFGVRHLSPSASFHLIRFLEKHKPKRILIEGPSDASHLISEIAQKGVKPPVALLGYTTELPIETVLYPFATYSPEYQAIIWGIKKKIDVRFIDLPSYSMLKLRQEQPQGETAEKVTEFYKFHNNLYQKLAQQYGETNYESYWERNFEHNITEDFFNEGLAVQSGEMREMVIEQEYTDAPFDFSYNLIREAYMKREIAKTLSEGIRPEEIVVIVGAYHVAGIRSNLPPMSDDELKKLPKTLSQLTLMPYSYLRLSSRTGYGAGNTAPYYFELMWETMQKNVTNSISATYLTKVAKILRENGLNASPASVIEAVRLADALTAMRGGKMPVLEDLHDAAITCFGGGELSVVAEALNRVDIGTAIGSLPEGVSQTPVQENINQELKRLKLTNYKSAVAQELTLDLRENLKVKSQEAAFIDLHRSTFLHRLKVLGIHFAELVRLSQNSATWAEKWMLQWSPEVEIEIVETNLKGETIEIAAAYQLREQLSESEDIAEVAKIIRQSCECRLTHIFDNALATLQRLLVDSNSFTQVASATHELSVLIQYGDLRQFDFTPLQPILQQLFLRGSLLLIEASSCDDKMASQIIQGINAMELVAENQYDLVDVETWQKQMNILALRDDLNARLSGVAFSILLEHNLATEEECSKEVSRRLSVGVPADLGASWFEGLSSRNRYALLSRTMLWNELDAYVNQLDDEEFLRSVVFLRRAFSDFEPNQKNSIAELLGDLWGIGNQSVSEIILEDLTEKETDKLNELNDFDFDF